MVQWSWAAFKHMFYAYMLPPVTGTRSIHCVASPYTAGHSRRLHSAAKKRYMILFIINSVHCSNHKRPKARLLVAFSSRIKMTNHFPFRVCEIPFYQSNNKNHHTFLGWFLSRPPWLVSQIRKKGSFFFSKAARTAAVSPQRTTGTPRVGTHPALRKKLRPGETLK